MYLFDGYQVLFSFSLNVNINLWERSITPPGLDGTGPIEVATMRVDDLRIRAPKSLATITEMTMVCAYEPLVYNEFYAIMQIIGSMTVTFPDGSTLDLPGWLDKFMPTEMTEGNMPVANVTFYPSMMDEDYVETAFVLTPP